jgi:hypothetical protein
MTRSQVAPPEFTPIFDWRLPRSRKLLLSSFIAASAMLHALCFYVFQIIYPPTVALLPPPARINIVNADSEEGRVLLRWVEAEDPALSSQTQRPSDASSFALPKPQHIASYVGHLPALKELPPYQQDLRVPSAQPPGPVGVPRPEAPLLAAPSRSRLQVSSEPAQPAEFRVGISAAGAVQYCFLERSSGDASLDDQARRALLLCRFLRNNKPNAPSSPEPVWCTATIEWGNDIAVSSPAP